MMVTMGGSYIGMKISKKVEMVLHGNKILNPKYKINNNCLKLQKQKFHKIHKKTPVPESFFNKVAG